MNKIRLCIINRNFPPEDCATGFHAFQLAKYLDHTGLFSVQLLSVNQQVNDSLNSFQRLFALSIYSGKHKIIRLLSSFLESLHLCWLAYRTKSDFYIVMTDPPFLGYFGSLLFKKKPWALWSMDLYPHAFAANKLVSESNSFYRHMLKLMVRFPPVFLISLGHRQAQFLNNLYHPSKAYIPIPVGIEFPEYSVESNCHSWDKNSSKVYLAYAGNIGEAHDLDLLIDFCKKLDSDKFTLILSVYGSKKLALISGLSDLPHIKMMNRLSSSDMTKIDIQVVSLKAEWTHICVPSRTLTAIAHGHHVIYFGSKESDSWEYISKFGFHAQSASQAIDHLHSIDKMELLKLKALAKEKSIQLMGDLQTGRKELVDKILEELHVRNRSSTS